MMRLTTSPLMLALHCAAKAQQHPRIFLTLARIAQLRDEIATIRKPQLDILLPQADLLAHNGPPGLRENHALASRRSTLAAQRGQCIANVGHGMCAEPR